MSKVQRRKNKRYKIENFGIPVATAAQSGNLLMHKFFLCFSHNSDQKDGDSYHHILYSKLWNTRENNLARVLKACILQFKICKR